MESVHHHTETLQTTAAIRQWINIQRPLILTSIRHAEHASTYNVIHISEYFRSSDPFKNAANVARARTTRQQNKQKAKPGRAKRPGRVCVEPFGLKNSESGTSGKYVLEMPIVLDFDISVRKSDNVSQTPRCPHSQHPMSAERGEKHPRSIVRW